VAFQVCSGNEVENALPFSESYPMKRLRRFGLLLGIAVAGICNGCNKPAPPPAGSIIDQGEPTQAQPKLKTMKLWLGAEEMITEVARTPMQQHVGMMFRTNMAENAGMLFPLPATDQASFWMKNCPLPLSIAYIDPEGVIQEIHDLEPHNTNAVLSASDNIRFALETPRGWFDRHQIHQGMVVRTEHGSLMETFFGK
jgi:uncharacterized membrane protein (UPF0127 family)